MRIKAMLSGALSCGLLAAAAAGGNAGEEQRGGPGALDVWSDPTFQKQFLGSYGIQAELEPRVTTLEREQMEEVLRLMQESDPGRAIEHLERILQADPRRGEPEPSAIFDFTLGNIYFQEEDLERAAQHYRNAIARFPSFRRAHKNLGIIQVRQGLAADGIGSLGRVVELGGGDGLTYGLLGYAYASTGQYVPAESAYRNAMLLEPDVPDWQLGLTLSALKQQKFGEAATLCGEMIARFPDRADLWLLQANAYIGMNQPLKAAENFEILQRMGRAEAQSLQTLGDIYVNEGLWDLAARAYGEALEPDRGGDASRSLRNAEVLAQRGALPQARALLAAVKSGHAARLDDTERKKLLKLEARIAVAEGQGGEAAEVLQEIVALDPLDGEALILLGQHYARVEEYEQAVFCYERAESLADFEAEAKVRHAQLLVERARYGDAVVLLKRAQEINPRDDIARYLEQVERVARAQR